MGYGTETKGYRLYDSKRGKIFYSRDVWFNELECGVEKESSEPDKRRYVELELELPSDDETLSDTPVQPAPRRSERERRPPVYYGEWANVSNYQEPQTFRQALESPDKLHWMDAMKNEIESIHDNDVWDLVELPKDRKAVGSKWVFKVKTTADGSIERYKACLVAQGCSQKYGVDYDETFSPVVRPESIRTLIALSVQDGLKLHQMDVTTAFLNGDLDGEIYMKQPEGFASEGQAHLVCKLKKSIYGLKQAPRCWNTVLDVQLKKMGFSQSTSDPCIYKSPKEEPFLIAVYVDDIILAGRTDKRIGEVKEALKEAFKVKDMGFFTTSWVLQ